MPNLTCTCPSEAASKRFPPQVVAAILGVVAAAIGLARLLIDMFNRRC